MADSIDRHRVCIVPFAAEHLECLAALEQECFSSPWSYESLLEELSNPMAVFLVAVAEGCVAGYVGMHHILDEGYITNIAIKEPYRRQGIGAMLLQKLKEYGLQNDMAFLSLEVRCSNVAAIALYKNKGYEIAGARKGFYTCPTEDALIMTYTF